MQTDARRLHHGHARRPRGRRDPAQVRALRLLHRDVPDLPAARRRARRSARAHLPHEAGARRRAGHRKTQLHLDRCLTCRSCETTCPSGVHYGRLLDIGRAVVEARTSARPRSRLTRSAAQLRLPRRRLFVSSLAARAAARGRSCPAQAEGEGAASASHRAGAWPAPRHARRMLVLEGCVQPAPRAVDQRRRGARARPLRDLAHRSPAAPAAAAPCRFHLNAQEEARDFMRAHRRVVAARRTRARRRSSSPRAAAASW